MFCRLRQIFFGRCIMRRFLLLGSAMVYIYCISSFSPDAYAAPSWTLFGLKGEVVNTILPLSGYGDNALMVGTSEGISYHEYGHWSSAWTGLPVYDMRYLPDHRILAAAGNGSDSDGIYIGKVIAIGEPGNLWEFKLLVKCPRPTAVEFDAPGDSCTGTVYAGNISGVHSGVLCNNSVDGMNEVPSPQNPFGMRCASMIFSAADSMLYAGGNYYGVEFDTGERDTALFIRGTTAMTTIRKMDIGSIAEYRSDGEWYMAIGTIENGIQVYRKGVHKYSQPSPANGEPVLALVPFIAPNSGSEKWTMLVAATPSGVFGVCPPDYDDCLYSHSQLPAVPGRPCCLAQDDGLILWAGTDSGLYRYDGTATPVRQGAVTVVLPEIHISAAPAGRGNVRFSMHGNEGMRCSLHLFDIRGRCVGHAWNRAGETVFTGLSGGCFLYRVTGNNRTVASGKILCR